MADTQISEGLQMRGVVVLESSGRGKAGGRWLVRRKWRAGCWSWDKLSSINATAQERRGGLGWSGWVEAMHSGVEGMNFAVGFAPPASSAHAWGDVRDAVEGHVGAGVTPG